MTTDTYLDRVMQGYVECAVWASDHPDTGEPLNETHGVVDIASGSIQAMRDDCAEFLADCDKAGLDVYMSDLTPEQIGHDFWLTRNRHGAGFWDRGLGDLGDQLTELCRPYGERYLWLEVTGSLACYDV